MEYDEYGASTVFFHRMVLVLSQIWYVVADMVRLSCAAYPARQHNDVIFDLGLGYHSLASDKKEASLALSTYIGTSR